MARVQVPVSDQLRHDVGGHPDEFGLDPSLSDAQRFAILVEEGARARRQQVRDARRAVTYAMHNDTAGYDEHLAIATAFAFEDGGF